MQSCLYCVDSVAQSVEHLTFNQRVLGSNPSWITPNGSKALTVARIVKAFLVVNKQVGKISDSKNIVFKCAAPENHSPLTYLDQNK
jgi:hypothetical protein